MKLVDSTAYKIREALMHVESATAQMLAKTTGIDAQTCSKCLENMVKRGFLERTGEIEQGVRSDGQPRKWAFVRMTAAGREQQRVSRDKVATPTRDALRQRKRDSKPRPKPVQTDAAVPGEFTRYIREHNWPPAFVPRYGNGPAPISLLQTVARRESDSATGKGWGSGTCVMAGTPGQKRPEMMGRAA